ncbi:PEP-CTERM protein-sorting domain-containing protein [Sphingomonas laterariae]|uniref:PEP-CTERM protein-sorting domain-containing protein n=1 Tax=Edaphosphingomonas laterariae TaxID=861865 RepID=A0A239FNG9_9SPHN|nr:NF038122 family metalloprotease [Sphingomonas laterariae]SNS58496.1 PEP-CTERM protein-sorting domain-containing protein [Sphingomonas laterariae]
MSNVALELRRVVLRSAIAAAALAVPLSSASAAKINLIDQGGVAGSAAEMGFTIAARYWESVLTNDVTLNFNVSYQDLGPGILGGTSTALIPFIEINQYYALLNFNSTKSTIDNMALANLAPTDASGGVNVLVPDYLTPATQDGVTAGNGTRLAPTNEEIGNTIAISSANAKALINDPTFNAGVIDAEIAFSSTFAFDFDPTDGISAGTYDFIGVAVHEIGHALGFLSAVEDFDYVSGLPGEVDTYWWGYTADLFRYSSEGQLDWTFGTPSYFSLDGGATAYEGGYWSTGSTRGDGWQASHWKEPTVPCTDFLGIMNPYICNGVEDHAEGLDLALLDAIGWNIGFDVAANPDYIFSTGQMFTSFVPEPATWAQMIMGFGLLGGAMRRSRKTRVTVTYA